MYKLHFLRQLPALAIYLVFLIIPAQVLAQTRLYTLTAPDGVNIAVQKVGNPAGPPIVFIHGLLGSHLNWDAQINSPLLQRYRLITYDLRGHGQSGKPTEAASYYQR